MSEKIISSELDFIRLMEETKKLYARLISRLQLITDERDAEIAAIIKRIESRQIKKIIEDIKKLR